MLRGGGRGASLRAIVLRNHELAGPAAGALLLIVENTNVLVDDAADISAASADCHDEGTVSLRLEWLLLSLLMLHRLSTLTTIHSGLIMQWALRPVQTIGRSDGPLLQLATALLMTGEQGG